MAQSDSSGSNGLRGLRLRRLALQREIAKRPGESTLFFLQRLAIRLAKIPPYFAFGGLAMAIGMLGLGCSFFGLCVTRVAVDIAKFADRFEPN